MEHEAAQACEIRQHPFCESRDAGIPVDSASSAAFSSSGPSCRAREPSSGVLAPVGEHCVSDEGPPSATLAVPPRDDQGCVQGDFSEHLRTTCGPTLKFPDAGTSVLSSEVGGGSAAVAVGIPVLALDTYDAVRLPLGIGMDESPFESSPFHVPCTVVVCREGEVRVSGIVSSGTSTRTSVSRECEPFRTRRHPEAEVVVVTRGKKRKGSWPFWLTTLACCWAR